MYDVNSRIGKSYSLAMESIDHKVVYTDTLVNPGRRHWSRSVT